MATYRLNDDTQDLARCATCAVMAEADCHSGADANTVCAMCGMPMVYSPSERDDSVGALQGRTLGGGTHQPRLQFVVSLAAIGGGSGFIKIPDYSSEEAQTESSLHSQPLPQSLSSLHAFAEHVALTTPPDQVLRMMKAGFAVLA